MCGIVGYTGSRQAKPILVDLLTRLEYRGYDSCGLGVRGGAINIYKDVVRVASIQQVAPALSGTIGIGHTRWATHGAPSAANAHPHTDCRGKIAVVHNGVITNFQKLRQQLTAEGHVFLSETDTEVIPHLVEKYYRGCLVEAVEAALVELEGSYAIVVLSEDEPRLVVARKDSPLIIGLGDGENLVASDVPAVLDYTNRVIYLENGDVGEITDNSVKLRYKGAEITRPEQRVTWTREDIQKAGYEHFMIKEIHEQPRVVRNTLAEYQTGTKLRPGLTDLSVIACGTSYHAGLIGKYVIEELTGIPVRVDQASEFNHRRRTIAPGAAIIITQSGETADVLSAMKKLDEAGVGMLVITNVPGSTASRVADQTVYIKAGPEVSVAATKSFIAQLVALYQLALSFPGIDRALGEQMLAELRQAPTLVQRVFEKEPQIIQCARYIARYESAFFIARGINVPVALEGALKLKEISYIHAEGYAAGELKHGPFALLHKDAPVIAVVAQDDTYSSMLTSIKEVKARNAPVIALADEKDETIDELVDVVIRLPHTSYLLSPLVNVIPMQLLAYYAARYRGCPIDFPRNLAKSVTVE